jgi:hypothetical protein
VQQNLVALNLVVIPPFLGAVRLNLAGVVVDAELRHQLKMDCFLDEVDVELHHLHQMGCYQDVALVPLELVPQELEFQHFRPHALPLHAWQLLPYWQLI